jgi:transposase
MSLDGHSDRSIARKLKTTGRTVRKWLSRYHSAGNVCAIPGKGRPLALNDQACSKALELLLDGECGGLRYVTQALKVEGLINAGVHATTVGRAVKRFARAQGDPLVCRRGVPPKGLTEVNKQKRVQFAKANLRRKWDRFLFTDRKKFHFKYPGSVVRPVRWVTKSGLNREAGVCRPNHPSVYNVYGGISKFGATRLQAVTGTTKLATDYKTLKGTSSRNITASEYRHVCQDLFLPEGKRIFSTQGLSTFCLQQDGDPIHKVAKGEIQKWNDSGKFHADLLEKWPGNSPDLNPIENVWAWVDSKVQATGCKTFDEFTAAVDSTFENIPKEMLKRLVGSMRKRLQLVIDNDGAKCGY